MKVIKRGDLYLRTQGFQFLQSFYSLAYIVASLVFYFEANLIVEEVIQLRQFLLTNVDV